MSPSALDETPISINSKLNKTAPLQLSGSLDSFESFDVTPIIGREFPTANLVDWLNAPNADELIRDLAITSMSLSIFFCLVGPITGPPPTHTKPFCHYLSVSPLLAPHKVPRC